MSDVCKHGSLRRSCETCEAIARAERAEAAVARLRASQNKARDIIYQLTDDEPCSFDHHGYCQTHGSLVLPCVNAIGLAYLEETGGIPG